MNRSQVITIAGWAHPASVMSGLCEALASRSGEKLTAVSTHDLALKKNVPSQADSARERSSSPPVGKPLQFSKLQTASRTASTPVRSATNVANGSNCYRGRSLERQSCRNDNFIDGISSYAAGLRALIEEQGGSAILIGWSMGGLVALETACHWPGMVKRLILVSATARFCSGADYALGIPVQNVRAMSRGLKRDPFQILNGFYRLAAEPFKEPLPVIRDQWQQVSGWIDELAGALDYLMNIDFRESLSRIQVPVLMLHGREDRVIPWPAADITSRALPDSRLGLYAAVGHDLPLREPAKLAADIHRFLAEV